MLTAFLVLVYIISVSFGVYFFDYKPDNLINSPLYISLSIVVSLFVVIFVLIIFMEVTYFFIAKRTSTTSSVKHYIGKQIVSVPMHILNIRTKVYGQEHLPKDPKFLIYANHTSELDISVLMTHLPQYPVAFLAKQVIHKFLSIGKWAVSIGCVMLNRENNRQGSTAVADVVEKVKNGSTMVVFPEGKVSRTVGALEKFRSGSFKIALSSGVPIVPITLVKEPQYNKKIWPISKRLDIVIHPPILFDNYKDLTSRQIAQQVRDIIMSKLHTKDELKKV